MNCREFEELLCDYVDGTLYGAQKAAVEQHRAECAACAEFAADVSGAAGFLERTARATPPADLVTRILHEIPLVRPPWYHRVFRLWIAPLLEPRYAMGMAMTVLSCSMLARAGGVTPSHAEAALGELPRDLDAARIWTIADERAYRLWDRTLKHIENLHWIRQVEAQWREWSEAPQPADSRG